MAYVPKAKKKKEPASVSIEVNPKDWPLCPITKVTTKHIIKAVFIKGMAKDTTMRITLEEDKIPLFNTIIENRLLSVFRKLYNEAVLIEFETHAQMLRREEILKEMRARRLRERLEKEAKKAEEKHELNKNK